MRPSTCSRAQAEQVEKVAIDEPVAEVAVLDMENGRHRIHHRVEKLQRLVRLAPRLHLLGDVGIGRDEAAIGHGPTAQQDDHAAGRLDLQP